ncbi:two-component system sensor histidine kinase CreC [Leptospira ilyithenensis]|uniref:histidine kinase n=1 Tax=Leptospira ilyithenensis TaxID=2484901 RepID=A0A4V3JXA4_9LEPT|nr:two-component system sensor histidine kinase CreC [Leptospira ilyithenensis]TGN13360.1 two-component system sensor histidine kinase CreC [Leptospira ilyithenensis]
MDSNCNRFFFILGLGFYYLINKTEESIRPRYMETMEESLNDTAHLFSAALEEDYKSFLKYSPKAKIADSANKILSPLFLNAKGRKFTAKIYSLTKTNVDLQIYVTDEKGIVVFDSEGYRKGLDYSKYNDVFLTLQKKYGVRSSKLLDPNGEGALFVAAPIQMGKEILGVITIVKPKSSVVPFIETARKKFWQISLVVAVLIAVLFVILAYLLFSPIRKLSGYVSALRSGKRVGFPKINLKEIRELGKEMDELVRSLEGKEYIENYVQTLTHEIKSPLSSILASAELLETNREKRESLILNIQSEGKRIQNLIERLLDLSSLEANKEVNTEESINLSRLVEALIPGFLPEAEKKSVSLRTYFETENITVQGNRFFLSLSVQNLIQNALDFSLSGNDIQINLKKEKEGGCILEVLDEGMGIPDYALSKIYDRFYSLPRPDSGKKSSGLGLAFVKQVALLHNAKLSIGNREGKGVSASIRFS